MTKLTMAQLLAKARTKTSAPTPTVPAVPAPLKSKVAIAITPTKPSNTPAKPTKQATGMHGEIVTYNEKQQEFIDIVTAGKDCVLTGAAGTGKTTCSQGALTALLASGNIPILNDTDGHKHLVQGSAGIIICSFTRRAVNNIRKVMPPDLKDNCVTIHKLLEYAPIPKESINEETGDIVKTITFEPTRHKDRPLPADIATIIIEEASMLGIDLFEKLLEALPLSVQFIYIGDIEQLPPVFGPARFGYAMTELPVIRLTEIYRQALDSPIIRLAHKVLSGIPLRATEFPEYEQEAKLELRPWKAKLSIEKATQVFAAYIKKEHSTGAYNPETDVILIPFNKAFGTLEVNKHIANYLARHRQAETFEIIAGFNTHYYSIGDKVLVDKEEATIVKITKNLAYGGKAPQPSSYTLDYWGYNPKLREDMPDWADGAVLNDVDAFLASAASDNEDRVTKASHVITVELQESNELVTLSTASEVNNMLHAYAITVHKSQGSEWRKVYFAVHHSHSCMLQRELLYTGITRAKESLVVICEKEAFIKGIINQKIKGNTSEAKIEYFKGKK